MLTESITWSSVQEEKTGSERHKIIRLGEDYRQLSISIIHHEFGLAFSALVCYTTS